MILYFCKWALQWLWPLSDCILNDQFILNFQRMKIPEYFSCRLSCFPNLTLVQLIFFNLRTGWFVYHYLISSCLLQSFVLPCRDHFESSVIPCASYSFQYYVCHIRKQWAYSGLIFLVLNSPKDAIFIVFGIFNKALLICVSCFCFCISRFLSLDLSSCIRSFF